MTDQNSPTINKNKKTLSVIIVSWNTRELLRKCLASIYTYPPRGDFEIWVVDNASTDGSADMVRKDFQEVNIIENDANTGFAQANNIGIRRSQAEFVLLLNPDTEVLPGALTTLIDYMKNTPEVGVVGPRILNPDKTLQPSCYPFPTLSREFWRLFHLDVIKPYGVYDMKHWPIDKSRKVDVLLGACMLMRLDVVQSVGLMSEDYFMYTEEVDLCYRISKNKFKNYWVPSAEIIHYGGQSTRQASRQMFIHLYKSKVLFFKKHYGRITAFLYKIVLLLASLTRLILTPLALTAKSPAREERIELAHNYRQLVKVLFTH